MQRKLIVALGLALLTAACGRGSGPVTSGGRPATFLGQEYGTTILIQWQQIPSGTITGTYTYDQSTGTAPTEALSTTTTSFTGNVGGDSVALTFTSFSGMRANVTGTLDGSTLTLNVPQNDGTMQQEAFTAASTSDFNNDVTALRGQIDSDNAQATRVEQAAASASAVAQARGQAEANAQDSANRAADATAEANCSQYGGTWAPGGTTSFTADGFTYAVKSGPTAASCQNVQYLGTDDSTYYLTVSFNNNGSAQPTGSAGTTATQSECQNGYYPDQSAGQTRQPPGNWSAALGICLPPR
jgi:hypothetical protein